MDNDLIYEEETYAIRGAIYEVYKTLGAGFLEEVYQHALEEEFSIRGIPFTAQKPITVLYKGKDCGQYIPDFICYDKIIVELKAVESFNQRHMSQVINYLHATRLSLGLLVNFGATPKVDIRRYAH